ncbi:MAG: Uncharacterized protein CEN91_358 [Candidatus Berkelbacteria bacterium Licking1014_85]|uniref:Nucleoid-associated protein n=1 Tax=Candidatus Berkelbacteria bacterium Licking1014_85 TaxID=2017148 RepID=A0A554LJ03_9BACT|nr:MAG: Uncharacterized protein CEN91_358 [Candidatus Berkelbacteria bacterium Licking1014_85]
MLDKMKQLYQMQKTAKEVQKKLKDTEIEAKNSDGTVTVIYNGEPKLTDVIIDDSMMSANKKDELVREILKLSNEAHSKAAGLAATEMKDVMKDMGLNIPGL